MYKCPACPSTDLTLVRHLRHFTIHRPKEFSLDISRAAYKCPLCPANRQYVHYRRHLREAHADVINREGRQNWDPRDHQHQENEPEMGNDANNLPINDGVANEVMDENEGMVVDDEPEIENIDARNEDNDVLINDGMANEGMDENDGMAEDDDSITDEDWLAHVSESDEKKTELDQLFDQCLAHCQTLESRANMTRKNVTRVASSYKSIILKAYDVMAANQNNPSLLKWETNRLFDGFSTEYKRKKMLDCDEFNVTAERKYGDCIYILVFMDDFQVTAPLGSASVAYKLCGCYIMIMNLPWWLRTTLDFIFLKFLAFTSDLEGDYDENLRRLLIDELLDLERDGIVIVRHGEEKRIKVILSQVSGDNLGLHTAYGLQRRFRGDCCCRHCNAHSDQWQGTAEVGELRTVEAYNAIINEGDYETMRRYAIRAECPFHVLENYHFLDAPTVDLMHDVLEGHLLYLMGHIYQELDEEYGMRRINQLIERFPFTGKYKKNQPRALEITDGHLRGYTAKESFNLARLFPIILSSYGIYPEGLFWTCLLQFEYVMDYLFAYEMPESKLSTLEGMIKEYVQYYIDIGGKMTPKTHYLVHYVDVIKKLGMPRFYWGMRLEGKHQPIKNYGNVNYCHKNLACTLSAKVQRNTASALRKALTGMLLVYVKGVKRTV
uniref:C2H2-type domain-containing protein n=1 Tax=Panagrolaimus sp. JU765 TaxID=591449 RepID=A0AC34PV43_9BILA